MEQVVYNFWGKKDHHLNTDIIFKNHMLIGIYSTFLLFSSAFLS